MTRPPLAPAHRLDALYPPHAVYLSAIWPEHPWLPGHPAHFTTGTLRPLARTLPVLCPPACASRDADALYALAGLEEVAPACPFAPDALPARLDALCAEGRCIAADHAPPDAWASRWPLVNPPALLAALDDKGALETFAPPGATPERRLVPRAALATLRALEPPVVLKASTWHSTGGGFDVRLCRDRAALRDAVAFFEGARAHLSGVVVERFERFRATWCAIFAATDTGVELWGEAQQVCDGQGRYAGNWRGLGFGMPAGARDLALHVARQGHAHGYRGVAGLDLGETQDGRLLVFDLNFRANGCLPQVLLHDAACARSGARVSRYTRLWFAGALARTLPRLRDPLARGWLVPVAPFDAAVDASLEGRSTLSALVLGDDVDDVERRIAALQQP